MLRSIQPGDTFRPKSLKGKTKKVKKYLTDLKLDRFSKERVLVVVSNGEILDIII